MRGEKPRRWLRLSRPPATHSIRSGKFSNNPNPLDADFDQHLDGETAEGNANNIIAFIREHASRLRDLTAALEKAQKEFGDDCPLNVAQPQESLWSPAKLTASDIAAQQEETAICAGLKERPAKRAKKPRAFTAPNRTDG